MDSKLEFASITGLTFAFIGLALLLLITMHIYVVIVITKHFRFAIRVEKARREIEKRTRNNVARMIRNKDSEEFWQRFLAGIDEEENN